MFKKSTFGKLFQKFKKPSLGILIIEENQVRFRLYPSDASPVVIKAKIFNEENDLDLPVFRQTIKEIRKTFKVPHSEIFPLLVTGHFPNVLYLHWQIPDIPPKEIPDFLLLKIRRELPFNLNQFYWTFLRQNLDLQKGQRNIWLSFLTHKFLNQFVSTLIDEGFIPILLEPLSYVLFKALQKEINLLPEEQAILVVPVLDSCYFLYVENLEVLIDLHSPIANDISLEIKKINDFLISQERGDLDRIIFINLPIPPKLKEEFSKLEFTSIQFPSEEFFHDLERQLFNDFAKKREGKFNLLPPVITKEYSWLKSRDYFTRGLVVFNTLLISFVILNIGFYYFVDNHLKVWQNKLQEITSISAPESRTLEAKLRNFSALLNKINTFQQGVKDFTKLEKILNIKANVALSKVQITNKEIVLKGTAPEEEAIKNFVLELNKLGFHPHQPKTQSHPSGILFEIKIGNW